MNVEEYLSKIDYPGRMILAGAGKYGEPVLAYALTGRSANSRNRVLVLEDGMLKTRAYDESLLEDPSLIIYNAMRKKGDEIILTNGDQTDTIYDEDSLEKALAVRSYEPDAPAFTPRISLVYDEDGDEYRLSIIRKADDSDECVRKIFTYKKENGIGHMIHTYMGNGDPLPSFSTLPVRLSLPENAEELSLAIHSSMQPSYRISRYVRFGVEEKIINDAEDKDGQN